MIEARFRQSNSEWARAAEIYRSLWTFYPDDSEYGLQLAGVEIASGQATDALATLTKLRKNSGQAMQNPQVDIEEAIAEENLSEAKKQLLAARKAVEEAGAAGSKFLLALGYWQECQASFVLGDLSGAEAACDEANRAADSAAGKREKARSLTLLATIREAQGHTSEAMELREEALAFARQTGSQKDIIGALFNLSVMKAGMGQLDEASQGYEEARKVAQEIGDERQLAIINIGDAAVLFTKGDFIAARNEFSEVFRAASKLGDMSDAILALQNSALVSLEVGDVAKALADAKEAKALATKSSLPDVEAVCSNTLGDILRAQADSAGAGKEYDFALAAFTRLGDQGNIAATHVSIINLLLEEGTTKGLAEMAQQAVEEFQREKATDLEASARAAWAMSLAADKRVDEALSQIKAAEQLPVLDLTIRLSLSLSKAHVLAAGQQWKDAEQVLEAGLRQAKKHKASRYELEIRLASLEIMALESKSKGEAVFHKQSLTDLEHDARESGYSAVALRAAKDSGQ
jgi:tetratricopeptide (TPR) repeat protein